jgi:DNA polymerase III delta prime subunit
MVKDFLTRRDEAVEAMKGFLKSQLHRRAVFLLLGKSKSGKTLALKKLARELGKEVVNGNLYLARYVKEKEAPKWMWEDLIEEGWRELFLSLKGGDFILIDNVEIFYDFPRINFLRIAEEECLLQKGKKAIIGVSGFVLGDKIYFCDDKRFLAQASDWRGRLHDMNY